MTQFTDAADGVKLAFESVGHGVGARAAILLVHGFSSSRVQNWRDPGWYEALNQAGYRVVAMDCRGHGESDKPHAVAAYDHAIMMEDIVAVMAAADLGAAIVMGYSMGGFLSLRLVAAHPERVVKLVTGGVGTNYLGRIAHPLTDPATREAIASGLLAPDKSTVTHPRARMFRDFADQQGKDRVALAACMRAMSSPLAPESFADVRQDMLAVCGEKDDIAGAPGPLATLFPHGNAVTVPRRDHMTVVGDRLYKDAVLNFLGR